MSSEIPNPEENAIVQADKAEISPIPDLNEILLKKTVDNPIRDAGIQLLHQALVLIEQASYKNPEESYPAPTLSQTLASLGKFNLDVEATQDSIEAIFRMAKDQNAIDLNERREAIAVLTEQENKLAAERVANSGILEEIETILAQIRGLTGTEPKQLSEPVKAEGEIVKSKVETELGTKDEEAVQIIVYEYYLRELAQNIRNQSDQPELESKDLIAKIFSNGKYILNNNPDITDSDLFISIFNTSDIKNLLGVTEIFQRIMERALNSFIRDLKEVHKIDKNEVKKIVDSTNIIWSEEENKYILTKRTLGKMSTARRDFIEGLINPKNIETSHHYDIDAPRGLIIKVNELFKRYGLQFKLKQDLPILSGILISTAEKYNFTEFEEKLNKR